MDTLLGDMSKVTNQEAVVKDIPPNEGLEVEESELAGALFTETSASSRGDKHSGDKQLFDSSLSSLLPKDTQTQQQRPMPVILPQVLAPIAAPVQAPAAIVAPAGGGAVTPIDVASVSNSLTPTPIAPSLLPGNNANTATTGFGAMPDMTAFAAATTAQQQLIWQQALQSLSLLAATQQQQQGPFSGALGCLPSNLGLQAVLPALASGGQQRQPGVAAPVSTTMPIPIASAPPSGPQSSSVSYTPSSLQPGALGRSTDDSNLAMERTAKRVKTGPPAPSVISSYDGNASDMPPVKMSDSELAKLSPAERRRYERNLREQQRSYRISQQIKSLRDVLTESNIPFKPNKYSILISVTNYIKELQARSIMLDADHNRLRETIKQTTELVASGQIPSSEESSGENNSKETLTSRSSSPSDRTTPDFLMVQGIDFKAAFRFCPYALGVCSLDGRILACNAAFERVMGCDQGEMEEQSLFLYIRNHEEIFEAMADLLKRSSIASETGVEAVKDMGVLYWCGNVVSANEIELALSITLTNVANGVPKFFSFSIATVG